MKKILFLAVVMLLANLGFSQTANNSGYAVAAFESQNHDFGKIKQSSPVTHEFKFTNKGKVPLVITNVQASCGCTTPAWSKEPIPPGGQGFVTAIFNAAAVGNFDKSITVTANVETGNVILRIHGEVVANLP